MSTPIFIINMPNNEDRWASTYGRVQSLGLDAKRFVATVGKELSQEERAFWYDEATNKTHYHRDLSPGEIGCYISHLRIWQKMVDENIEKCIVLEDDLLIDAAIVDTIEQANRLSGWDIIKLSGDDYPFKEQIPLTQTLTLGNFNKCPNGCHGYLVSLEGAKKLLKRKPFYRPVDVDIQFHSEIELQVLAIKPYCVKSDDQYDSEIAKANNGSHSNRSTFWRNLKFKTRLKLERLKKSADMSKIDVRN